jgi:hypothetical protein
MITVLTSTTSPSRSTEFIRATISGKDYRMKIVAENGNCYSRLQVYTVNMESGIHMIAEDTDIPGYNRVNFVWSDADRTKGNTSNIEAATVWITKTFGYFPTPNPVLRG